MIEIPLREKNGLLEKIYGIKPLKLEDIVEEYLDYGERLSKHVVDCTELSMQPQKTRRIFFSKVLKGLYLT